MIVHKPACPHERVADRRSGELQSATEQIAAHGVRFRSAWGPFTEYTPPVHAWLAADERPDVGVKAAEDALNQTEGFGVLDRAHNLQSVANDAGILEQSLNSRRCEPRHLGWIEPNERLAIRFPLLEDRLPAKARLRTFQRQELEQDVVVVNRHTPLGVVVGDAERSSCPSAANDWRH